MDEKESRDATKEAVESLNVTMEARLLLGDMSKLFAIVFTAVFWLRKLSSPMPPAPKTNAKSAEMSQGSGSEMVKNMVQKSKVTQRVWLHYNFTLRDIIASKELILRR